MQRPENSRLFFSIVIIALIIKLSLFAFTAIYAPKGKLLPDSYGYLKLADTIAAKGVFATPNENGSLNYEIFRTPGYPLFLAILHGILKIPLNGIILLQIAMTLLAAFIIYRAACEIDQNIALLSMVIILFDIPTTIFSLTILTESLFLPLISLFTLNFTLYLKRKRISYLVISALMLGIATYVRPISYYLGFAVFFFILCANIGKDFRKHFMHAVIFIAIVYSIVGLWQVRNHARCGNSSFCSAGQHNLTNMGLFKSYARNTDPYTKGMAPLPYYISVSVRSLLSVMTKPGTFKYFDSDILTAVGKVLGYAWVMFWLPGFIIGIIGMRRNIYIQFMLFAAFYFIFTSVGAQMWIMGDKLRISIMPFIAIISAYGWTRIRRWVRL